MKSLLPRAALALWLLLALGVLVPCLTGAGGGAGGADIAWNWGRLTRLGWNSFLLAAMTALFSLVPGVLAAVTAMRLESPRARWVLLVMASLMLLVPPPVLAVAAIRIFGPAGWLTGLITEGAASFPVAEQISATPAVRPAPVYTLPGGAFTLAMGLYPLVALAAAAALARTDPEAEQAASLDAGPLGVLRRISLPLALPGIWAGAALTFLFAITEFGVPESLRSLPVLVSEVYVQFGVAWKPPAALAASAVLLAIAALGAVVAVAAGRRLGGAGDDAPGEQAEAGQRLALSAGTWTVRVLGWLGAAGPLVIVVGSLLATATGPQGPGPVWAATWTTAHQELGFSLGLGAVSAAVTLVAGVVLAALLWSLPRPGLWRWLIAAPLVVPGPVYGVALAWLLRRPSGSLPFGLADALADLSQTYVPLLFVWTVKFAPLVALLTERALRRIPRDQIEAARLDGARAGAFSWAVWSRIAAPAIWPSALAGALAAFAFALAEVGAALLLLPPGHTTLSVRLLTLMHFAPTGQVSALSLMVMAPGVAALAVGWGVWRVGRGGVR